MKRNGKLRKATRKDFDKHKSKQAVKKKKLSDKSLSSTDSEDNS